MNLRAAEGEVLAAAETVVHAYRVGGGYTLPLSVTLRRLDDAVHVYLAAVHAAGLDSDTNGFDRSTVWGEENSNEQSNGSEASPGQRRQGCAAAKVGKPEDGAQAGEARPRKRG